MSTRGFIALITIFSMPLGSACGESENEAGRAAEASKVARPFPAGRWRLLSFEELDQTVLWLSHILIAHRQSTYDTLDAIRPHEWGMTGQPADRTREEALALALLLAKELQRNPEQFSTVARTRSDDAGSRDVGGSLGGVRASQIGPSFRDAVQATPVGRTSSVFETKQGFHIVLRSARPVADEVSGQHITIRYRGDVNTELLGSAPRDRNDAHQRALSISASEKAFVDLVKQHSEDQDRLRDGDMGVWSTIAPRHNGVLVETLSKLRIGEVSEPVDTPEGFQVLKRVPVTARAELAAAFIYFPYDPGRPSSEEGSRSSTEKAAREVLDVIKRQERSFADYQAQLCCEGVESWTQGHREAAVELALMEVPVGGVIDTPIDIGWRHTLVARRQLGPKSERVLTYELASPAQVNLEGYLLHSDGKLLAAILKRMKSDIARNVSSASAQELSKLDSIISSLEVDLVRCKTGKERVEANRRAIQEIDTHVSSDTARQFHSFSRTWLVNFVMSTQ